MVTQALPFTFQVASLEEELRVVRFDGDEGLSQLFQFEIQLSAGPDITCADVLGKAALLTIESQGEPRYVHGIVSRFEQGPHGDGQSLYRATLVPTVWPLVHRHDSRIFQELSIPQIMEKVFESAGISLAEVKWSLSGKHPVREYCVQYRESDWAFISRLMEEEGIFYFFHHQSDADMMMVADGGSVHRPIEKPSTLAFQTSVGAMTQGEGVLSFTYAESVLPGKVSLTDFDFKKPMLALGKSAGEGPLEVYDYPGEYDAPAIGEELARIRLEEARAVQKIGHGESTCVRLAPGYLFSLSDHGRDANNRQYLVTRLHHRGGHAHGEGSGELRSYSQEFEVIPAGVPYRPARFTPRPIVRGVQTAIVVGPGNEEIYTDEHGRVKVHFHWDRQGKRNEKSSCWIRVSQLWAGAGWGAMWIPRVGHEVIVEFIEGDPDRPIIVGRVYHGANVPPYALPAERTKSTIKSNSTPAGEGSNEPMFEDKKGGEQIYLHGQRDWNIKIENDKTQLVGNDERLEVEHDRNKEVRNDQHEIVGRDKTIDVGGDHNESIGKNESVMIGANAERTVAGSLSLSVGETMSETVGGNSLENVSGSKSVEVDESMTIKVVKELKVTVSKDSIEKVDEKKKIQVGKTYTLMVGDGSVSVDKDGTITIQGKDITIKGAGKINVQGGKKIVLKSDGPVEVDASSSVKIKGSTVGVN